MVKEFLGEKVTKIARESNVSEKTVHKIISYFLEYKSNELFSGKGITLSKVVDIIPEPLIYTDMSTLAYVAKDIADKHSYPYNTVLGILQYYMETQKIQLSKGYSVIFRGLVKIHPKLEGDKIVTVHSFISSSLTHRIEEQNFIQSLRVHTSKILRNSLKGKILEGEIPSQDVEEDIDAWENA